MTDEVIEYYGTYLCVLTGLFYNDIIKANIVCAGLLSRWFSAALCMQGHKPNIPRMSSNYLIQRWLMINRTLKNNCSAIQVKLSLRNGVYKLSAVSFVQISMF